MNKFNIGNMKLDIMKRNHFIEFLNFKLKRDRRLRFSDFNRGTGISRQQWDVFRIDNKGLKKVHWVVE